MKVGASTVSQAMRAALASMNFFNSFGSSEVTQRAIW